MSSLIQLLRENLRDNFGATVFLIVAASIGLIFVLYLVFDAVKNAFPDAFKKRKRRPYNSNKNP